MKLNPLHESITSTIAYGRIAVATWQAPLAVFYSEDIPEDDDHHQRYDVFFVDTVEAQRRMLHPRTAKLLIGVFYGRMGASEFQEVIRDAKKNGTWATAA